MSPERPLQPSGVCSRAIAYLKPALDPSGPAVPQSYDDSPVTRDLANGLIVTYVIDDGDALHFVQRRHLREEGVSPDDLHTRSLANLATFARSKLEIRRHSQIFAFLCGGNFEASLLLVDGLWDVGVAGCIEQPYIAAIPARDMLAVCGLGAAGGVQELRELVGRVTPGGDHLITPELYIRQNGHWRVLEEKSGRTREAT